MKVETLKELNERFKIIVKLLNDLSYRGGFCNLARFINKESFQRAYLNYKINDSQDWESLFFCALNETFYQIDKSCKIINNIERDYPNIAMCVFLLKQWREFLLAHNNSMRVYSVLSSESLNFFIREIQLVESIIVAELEGGGNVKCALKN